MVATFAIGLTITPAQAQETMLDATADDIDCVIALNELDDQNGGLDKETLDIANIFYMGKILGREPDIDLQTAIVSRVITLTAEDASLEAIALSCASEMVELGAYLESVGSALEEG